MARRPRNVRSDGLYHVFDHAVGGQVLFVGRSDYDLFLGLAADARQRHPVRILAYCLMPNHWHLVLQPGAGTDLSGFVGRLKQEHTRKVHARRGTGGTGHLYRARYRLVGLDGEEELVACARYVERNALTAGLCRRAEDWPWGSLRERVAGRCPPLLDPWPVPIPTRWVETVNTPWETDRKK